LEDTAIQGLKKVVQVSVSKGWSFANTGKTGSPILEWKAQLHVDPMILYFKISLRRVQSQFMSCHIVYFSFLSFPFHTHIAT